MPWAPVYSSVAELKSFLRIPADDTVDDTELGLAVEAASRVVDQRCNRQFGVVASPEVRYYRAVYDPRGPSRGRYVVEVDDVATVTGMVIEVDTGDGEYTGTVATGAVTGLPINNPARGFPWTHLELPDGTALSAGPRAVKVTASWGWAAVPDPVEAATLLQASWVFKRRDAPFGIAGSPEMGSEMRLLSKLDPTVAVVLRPYVRWWAAR